MKTLKEELIEEVTQQVTQQFTNALKETKIDENTINQILKNLEKMK